MVRYFAVCSVIAAMAMGAHAQDIAPPIAPLSPAVSDVSDPSTGYRISSVPAPIPADMNLPQVDVPGASPVNPEDPTAQPPSPELGDAPLPASASEAPLKIVTTNANLHFDDFGYSLFYTPNEINKLKAALDIADALARRLAEGVTKVEEAITPLAPEPPKIEISEYPVFYLSSIMFQGGNKWVVWLNGTRATSKSMPTDLQLIGINSSSARFRWKPSIFEALQTRWKSEEGDAKKTPMKQFIGAGNSVTVDQKAGAIEFSLRPNQTYSGAYNVILEGKHAPVSVGGDNGIISMGDFERNLRETQDRNATAARSNSAMPRVVRPNSNNSRAPISGRSTPPKSNSPTGLVKPDAATINQVPSIFPGGIPAAPQRRLPPSASTPPAAPDSAGLPILPPGSNGN